jgi:protein-tyrosine phosphatase
MKCARILPNLFIGPDPRVEEEFEQLRSQKITAILSLQTDDDVHQGGVAHAKEAAEGAGFIFCSTPVTDFDRLELRRKLPECVAKLDELLNAGHTVYIHCTAGVNRSPTIAAAYLHWRLGWPLEKAVAHLESVRNCCPDVESIRSAGGALLKKRKAGI